MKKPAPRTDPRTVKSAPQIDPRAVEVTEEHAERVIGEMLAWLVPAHRRMLDVATQQFRSSAVGNPKSQIKMAARIATSPAVLGYRLVPGKRASFNLVIWDWAVFDPGADEEATFLQGELSKKLWIVVFDNQIDFYHGRQPHEPQSIAVLFVCHHALVRLAMRAQCRTWQDLCNSVAEIWAKFFDCVGPELNLNKRPEHIRLDNGCWAALEPYLELPGYTPRPSATIVTTILSPNMVDDDLP
jgi:hypothetical protein